MEGEKINRESRRGPAEESVWELVAAWEESQEVGLGQGADSGCFGGDSLQSLFRKLGRTSKHRETGGWEV